MHITYLYDPRKFDGIPIERSVAALDKAIVIAKSTITVTGNNELGCTLHALELLKADLLIHDMLERELPELMEQEDPPPHRRKKKQTEKTEEP